MVVPGLVQRRRFLPRPFPGNAIDWSSSALASDIKSCGLTLKQLGSCAGVARSELGLPSRSTALLLEPGRRGGLDLISQVEHVSETIPLLVVFVNEPDS